MKTQIWHKSDKTAMSRARARTVCLFDDNDFDEKKGRKPHVQPLNLQSEVIMLRFLFNRILSNKLCFDFGFDNTD